MVLSVGYSGLESVMAYDTAYNTEEIFTVEKIDDYTVNSVTKFFSSLTKRIKKTIDFLVVHLNHRYTSNYRKKVVKTAKKFGILNVRIIGVRQMAFFEAINTLSFEPKNHDVLWIFVKLPQKMVMDAWKFNEIKKWKFCGTFQTEKYEENFTTIEALRKLLKKNPVVSQDRLPYILCLYMNDINQNDFSKVFPSFQMLKFQSGFKRNKAALNYARFLSGENGFLKYETEIILSRYFHINVNNSLFCKIAFAEVLPFSAAIFVDAKRDDEITLYEEDNVAFSVSVKDEGKYEMLLTFDLNGIHTLNVKRCVMDRTDKKSNTELISLKESKSNYNIPLKLSNYDATLNAIGIDLGTTECCAAVIRKNGPDFVVLDSVTSLRTMPSYIAFDEKVPKCGQVVVDRMRHKAKYSIFDVKRIIGKEFQEITIDLLWPFKVLNNENQVLIEHENMNGKEAKSPEEITSVLLNHIKKACEAYQSQKISEVVIAIPSEFSEAQKRATKSAVEYVGFETIHFIPEPIAAAFAYFSEMDIPNQSNILICDCGGGTIDICIAEIASKQLTVLSYNGDSYLGGRDFDKILFNHFNAILKHKFGIDVTLNSKKYILKQKCQDIKHTLSAAAEAWLDVSDFNPNSDDVIKITRDEFESMTNDILLKIKNVILQAVIKSKIEKQEINYVFQVGGGCRMPMIKCLLADIFPEANHQCNLYPDWVVAHGAALYAYFLKQNDSKYKSNSSGDNVTAFFSFFLIVILLLSFYHFINFAKSYLLSFFL